MSYILVSRESMKPVAEIFNERAASVVDPEIFHVLPARVWLEVFNRAVKAAKGEKPNRAQIAIAMAQYEEGWNHV